MTTAVTLPHRLTRITIQGAAKRLRFFTDPRRWAAWAPIDHRSAAGGRVVIRHPTRSRRGRGPCPTRLARSGSRRAKGVDSGGRVA
jgi:hypothetical protein